MALFFTCTEQDPGDAPFTLTDFCEANREDPALPEYVDTLKALNVGESASLEWPDMIFTRVEPQKNQEK